MNVPIIEREEQSRKTLKAIVDCAILAWDAMTTSRAARVRFIARIHH
jgi:hypothetical protein